MSTGFLFAFCVASPVVILTLNKGGPKPAIVTTSALLLVGNWVRYAGTKARGGIFGVAMFGQLLIGLAQPFCLSAPTRYSDLWFSDRGRISATAVATLANPLGAALGQLINSFWATTPEQVPDMVLYISIIVGARRPIAVAVGKTACISSNTDGTHNLTGNSRINPIILHSSRTPNTPKSFVSDQ
jgi:hypothetical protein